MDYRRAWRCPPSGNSRDRQFPFFNSHWADPSLINGHFGKIIPQLKELIWDGWRSRGKTEKPLLYSGGKTREALLARRKGRKKTFAAPHAFQECRSTTEENPRTGLPTSEHFLRKKSSRMMWNAVRCLLVAFYNKDEFPQLTFWVPFFFQYTRPYFRRCYG